MPYSHSCRQIHRNVAGRQRELCDWTLHRVLDTLKKRALFKTIRNPVSLSECGGDSLPVWVQQMPFASGIDPMMRVEGMKRKGMKTKTNISTDKRKTLLIVKARLPLLHPQGGFHSALPHLHLPFLVVGIPIDLSGRASKTLQKISYSTELFFWNSVHRRAALAGRARTNTNQ